MGSASGGSLRCKQADRAANADVCVDDVGEDLAWDAFEGPVAGQNSDCKPDGSLELDL